MLYEIRIRFQGRISYITVQANSVGHAKALARADYGPEVEVLSAKLIS